MTQMNIRALLRGCQVGQIQTIGVMQMIPLLSDEIDDRFASPYSLRIRTTAYGSMCFTQTTTEPYHLIPTHVTYLSRQKAQDHALMQAKFLKGAEQTFNDAACVQQSQCGYLDTDGSEMTLLPLCLRERALSMRDDQNFGKLWNAIGDLRGQMGQGPQGNLVEFTRRFKQVLDQFVAEFERDEHQIGAIILVNGSVVGVERCPNYEYFKDMWEPLIRGCYAAEAVRQIKTGINSGPRTHPLRVATDLKDLRLALQEAHKQEEEEAKLIVRELLNDPFEAHQEDLWDQLALSTISNAQFTGQVVQESEVVHYVSITVRSTWNQDQKWRQREAFDI